MKSYLSVFILSIIYFSYAGTQSSNSSLTKEEQSELVSAHNKWRAMVGVDSVAWSEELAEEAQKWAEYLAKKGCRMKHSNTKNGENIYWSDYKSSPVEVVSEWASERKYYKGEKIKPSKISKYGHYTQMIWHNTKYVGCGKAICKNGSEIWVCSYSPAGNFLGERAY